MPRRTVRSFPLCMLLLSLWAASATAQTRVLERAGPWEAYFSVTPQTALCGISQFSGPYGFMLKYDIGARVVLLHLSKRGWVVPADTRLGVVIEVDGRRVWRGDFTGTEQSHLIEARLTDRDQATAIVSSFALGIDMRINFTEGDEAPWRVPLGGTLRVTNAFLGCIRAAREALEGSTPTQPHQRREDSPRPTQPFVPGSRV